MKMFKGMLLALIPATLLAVYFFREKAVLLILVSVGVAVGSEALFQFLFKRKYTIKDGSAMVTGYASGLVRFSIHSFVCHCSIGCRGDRCR
ncbi:RnfABCDGE type electron transport complex subunit D [Alkalibacter rhizosphaerae]|uniref:RnfABCDGE type electron transport complex subunit D n=1 Tax=Alkalibacter rhizosphaerae TaxID=2815577 RepID=A0A975AGR2_9FIRM|nr:RnfABCDGE type electron transport complex subunit D [Alkalibacter rhizosphaerae]QSX07642.1 RnfABCDGE type electron transport complex subunit D [Alkalibacter rhizosphaerae]